MQIFFRWRTRQEKYRFLFQTLLSGGKQFLICARLSCFLWVTTLPMSVLFGDKNKWPFPTSSFFQRQVIPGGARLFLMRIPFFSPSTPFWAEGNGAKWGEIEKLAIKREEVFFRLMAKTPHCTDDNPEEKKMYSPIIKEKWYSMKNKIFAGQYCPYFFKRKYFSFFLFLWESGIKIPSRSI